MLSVFRLAGGRGVLNASGPCFCLWWICTFAIYLLLAFTRPEGQGVASFLISGLALFAFMVHFFVRGAFRDPFHPDIFLAIAHVARFILPALLVSLGCLKSCWHPMTIETAPRVPQAVFAVMLAQGCFNLPFYVLPSHARQICWDSDRVGLCLIGVFAVLTWTARVFLVMTGSYFHSAHSDFSQQSVLYSPLAIFSTMSLVVVIFAAFSIFKRRNWRRSLPAFSYLAGEILWGVFSGKRMELLLFIVALILVYTFVYRRVNLKQILFFCVFLVVFGSTMHFYRRAMKFAAKNAEPVSIKQAMKEGYAEQVHSGPGKTIWVVLERLHAVKYTVGCMDHFPSQAFFLGGSTYRNILWSPIPKILCPNKKIYPYEYNALIQPWFTGTVAHVTAVGEAYMNFGWYGIIIVFSLSGIFYRGIDSAFLFPSRLSVFEGSLWIFYCLIMIKMAIVPAFSGFSWIVKIGMILLFYRACKKVVRYVQSGSLKSFQQLEG